MPGTSPPPVSTSVGEVASEKPPPYSPTSTNQPVYTSPYDASVLQEENQPPVLVRNVQYYEPDPPGLSRTITCSLVLSSILLTFVVPMFCAIPALIFASLALSRKYDVNQRKSYANIALNLTRAGYATLGVFISIGTILKAIDNSGRS